MKRSLCLLTGLLGLASASAQAGDMPRGSLLELHSCELFAGGCVVSAEAPQGGRLMVRAWNFSGGTFQGINLTGLQLAVLQSSPDNLAMNHSQSGDAVVYLPQSATQAQRDALLAWLKSSHKDFAPAKLQTRIVPLQMTRSGEQYAFTAADFISVQSVALACESTACGEELWYEPRTATSLFTVALNRSSRVAEPFLKLTWTDSGKRSVFLARFGDTPSKRDVYVTMGELCGQAGSLF